MFSIDGRKRFGITLEKKERKKMKKMNDENGNECEVGFMGDDCGWDPIMGDDEDWVDTDDEWLDDFQGEEDWA